MSRAGTRTITALALQVAALAALSLALLGAAWLDPRAGPRLLVLLDRSSSVPRAEADQAMAEVARAAKAAGAGKLLVIEFAARTPDPAAPTGDLLATLDPSATNIEAALQAALAAHAQAPLSSLVVISDGLENVGDAVQALRALREAALPTHWFALGRAPPPTRLADVLAPARAQRGQRIPISVQLAGRLDLPLRVTASARGLGGAKQTVSGKSDGSGRVGFEFDAAQNGALIVDLSLEHPATGQVLDTMTDAAVIDVAPRAAILYALGSSGALARSLKQGGWQLDLVAAARLDSRADGLDSYQAVVLDDIAISDASPRFWNALVAAVRDRGLGLLVLGGERSFARGGYRGSTLESVLPLSSEPAALDEPLSLVFAVDKSGSMGQASAGVDRFQLARRAVAQTAGALTRRDALGLLVFDVEPRWLLPLSPAEEATRVLSRDWPTSPNGGTRLAPALDAAMAALERSGPSRRMLVLVTDGFVDEAPLAGLRERLARSRIEIVALAVGPDADVSALERVLGADAGIAIRVSEAAELPSAMRSGVERRRSRVERGVIGVEQRLPLPLASVLRKDWPAVAAHALTRPQPQATVAVQSLRGEPLIAYQRAGRGLVVAVTSGLGPWAPQWLPWQGWPQLAGGLTAAVAGTPGAAVIRVAERPGQLELQIEGDRDTARLEASGGVSASVSTPREQGLALAVEPVGPGHWRAALPDAGPGLYTFIVSTPMGIQRQLHLRRARAEAESWGISPQLAAWRTEGLLTDWKPSFLAHHDVRDPGQRPLDRSLLALAMVLFVAAILVDRQAIGGSGMWRLLRKKSRPS